MTMPSPSGTTTAIWEADGVNGVALVPVNVYPATADPGTWPSDPTECIGEGAEDEFASGSPGTVHLWNVRLNDTRVDSVTDRYIAKLDMAGLWGPEDWPNAKAEWHADRVAETAASSAAFAAVMTAYPSCTIVELKTVLPYATIECTVADAEALWAAGDVACIDLEDYRTVDDDATGSAAVNGHGLRDFMPDPFATGPSTSFTGYTPGRGTWEAVVLESTAMPTIDQSHFGFRTPGGLSRIISALGCKRRGTVTDCRAAWVDFNTDTFSHPTGTMSALAANLMEGQDPAFPVATNSAQHTARENLGGMARGISAHTWSLGRSQGAFVAAMEEAEATEVDLVNMSASFGGTTGRRDCDGVHGRAAAMADLFEAGTPFFKSAGNMDEPGRKDGYACNVGAPGGSTSAFTVAAVGNATSGSTRSLYSSHGDPTARRTLVDMAVSSNHSPWLDRTNVYGPGFGGTSSSTPTMAGAALVYRDAYESLPGSPTFIRLPEVLYSRLLVHGDGTGQFDSFGTPDTTDITPGSGIATGPVDEGFDAAWGAGRLSMRQIFDFDPATGTFPRNSRAGSVCVGDDEIVELNLGALEGYTGSVTIVSWFHDERYAKSGTMDEIDLLFGEVVSMGGRVIIREDDSRQEMARVRVASLPSSSWVMQLHGVDVTGSNGSCDVPNTRRVFYAYAWD